MWYSECMERERFGGGEQKMWVGIFGLIMVGMIVVLGVYVVNRLDELEEVCLNGVRGVSIREVCGLEDE